MERKVVENYNGGWLISCKTEKEADELVEAVHERRKNEVEIVKEYVKLGKKSNKKITIFRFEDCKKIFDKFTGKWIVIGEVVTMDNEKILEKRKNEVENQKYYHMLEKQYLEKTEKENRNG